MGDTFVHFEIPADDPGKLEAFYSSAFGWQFQHVPMPGMPGDEYILIQTAEQGQPGLNGGMYRRTGPDDKSRSFIGVSSIDDTLDKVTASGGTVVQPKMKIPNVGWAAMISDPEGNVQGVFEGDETVQ